MTISSATSDGSSSFDLFILTSSPSNSQEEKNSKEKYSSYSSSETDDEDWNNDLLTDDDNEQFDNDYPDDNNNDHHYDHHEGNGSRKRNLLKDTPEDNNVHKKIKRGEDETEIGWQSVSGSKDKFYVYSAFLDVRDNSNKATPHKKEKQKLKDDKRSSSYFSMDNNSDNNRNVILVQNVKSKATLSSGPYAPLIRIISITRTKILSHPEDNVYCRFFYPSDHHNHRTRHDSHGDDSYYKSSKSNQKSFTPKDNNLTSDHIHPHHGPHTSNHDFGEKKDIKENVMEDDGDQQKQEEKEFQKEEKEFKDVRATIKVIRENWNLRYSAAFVLCPLPPLFFSSPSTSSDNMTTKGGKKSSEVIMDGEYIRERLDDLRIPDYVSVLIKTPSPSSSISSSNSGYMRLKKMEYAPNTVRDNKTTSQLRSTSSPFLKFNITNRLKVINRFSLNYELRKRGSRLSSDQPDHHHQQQHHNYVRSVDERSSYGNNHHQHDSGENNHQQQHHHHNPSSANNILSTISSGVHDHPASIMTRITTTTNTTFDDHQMIRGGGKEKEDRTFIPEEKEEFSTRKGRKILMSIIRDEAVKDDEGENGEDHKNKGNSNQKRGGHERRKRKIAVCVKPMHYDYDKLINFIQFIEFNQILGVDKFILYNHTIGPRVNCLLNQIYKREKIVEVHKWNLPFVSQKEIRTEGLFASLNDCLYRTMFKYDFVLMIDFDEFIVPHAHNSLQKMIESILKTKANLDHRAGGFSFQNSFFYLQWSDDIMMSQYNLQLYQKNERVPDFLKDDGDDRSLIILKKTRRKSRYHPHKQRSKVIVNPRDIIEMGNHFVWEFKLGKSMVNVSPKLGFLHHYRICEFGGDDCIKDTSSTLDRRTHHWSHSLIPQIRSRLIQFEQLCSSSSSHNLNLTTSTSSVNTLTDT